MASAKRNDEFLLTSGFNTGIGRIDGPMKVRRYRSFRAIQTNGFADVWRHFRGDLAEHTYTWPRNGSSYRIDQALASRSLLLHMRSCRYSHDERDHGASGHSPILLEIA
jgi:exonuclease III